MTAPNRNPEPHPPDAAPAPAGSSLRTTRSPFATFFIREFSQYFQGRRTIWGRIGFLASCALAVFLTFAIMWERSATLPPEAGRIAFATLMIINTIYSFSLINSTFSQIIIAEREQGGFDLLRITGLSPLALIVGKGGSQYCRALLSLSLQAPLCVLCVLAGHLAVREIGAAYLLLAAVLFAACQMGAYASVVCKTTRQAAHYPLGLFLVLIVVPLAIMAAFRIKEIGPPPAWLVRADDWLLSLNPFSAFTMLFVTGEWSWQVPAFYLAAGAVFLALAVRRFESAAERPYQPPGLKTPAARGNPSRRGLIPRVWAQPLRWKEFYFTGTGPRGVRMRWLLYPAACLLPGIDMHVRHLGWLEGIAHSMLAIGLLGISSELPYAATRLFGTEVANQTLGDIVTLPIPLRRVVKEKILGHVPSILPPLCLAVAGAVLSPPEFFDSSDAEMIPILIFLLVQVANVLLLTVHFSLRQPRAAFGSAFMLVAFASGIMTSFTMGLLHLSSTVSLVALTAVSLWGLVYLIRFLPFHVQFAASK